MIESARSEEVKWSHADIWRDTEPTFSFIWPPLFQLFHQRARVCRQNVKKTFDKNSSGLAWNPSLVHSYPENNHSIVYFITSSIPRFWIFWTESSFCIITDRCRGPQQSFPYFWMQQFALIDREQKDVHMPRDSEITLSKK